MGLLKFVRPLCASLPGLNYASAEGAKAFEELADVIAPPNWGTAIAKGSPGQKSKMRTEAGKTLF